MVERARLHATFTDIEMEVKTVMKPTSHRAIRLVVVVFLLAGSIAAASPARAAAEIYPIQIAAFLEGVPAESMRFLPGRVQVNPGDVLRFQSEGFHTATLLPIGVDADGWVQDYNVDQTNQPWATIIPDPDEGSGGGFKINTRVAFPSRFDCGTPDAPCAFDGSGDPVDGVLNSGLAQGGPLDFSVTVTAPVGSTFTVLCLIHSQMRLRVDVVAEGQESDPSTLAAETDDTLMNDAEESHALHARYSARKTKHRTPSGVTVWDAWAGIDAGHVSLFGMYPKKLAIRRGQRVQWHFGGLIFEPHTVTFPLDKGLALNNGFPTPVCDPDGDEGPGPDVSPSQPPPVFCEGGPEQLELQVPNGLVPEAGNGSVMSHGDFESSGWRGTLVQPTAAPYTLRFPRRSKDRAFRYLCMIHPGMRGKVIVR